MLDDSTSSPGSKPKAYINWILFDEQFRVVRGSSGFSQVGNSGEVYTHPLRSVEIAKNGYLYVYCSNESDSSVFFDNLQVIHNRGPLLEETHYYPFGLTMAGISSKAAGKLENRYKYNEGTELGSKEFSDGTGLDFYETRYRSLDPQLGRFWQVDPMAQLTYNYSPYLYGNNNPILINDPLGLQGDTMRGTSPDVVVKTVKPKPKVQVLIWSKEARKDVGHTAIRINEKVYGYYPTSTNPNAQGYGSGDLWLPGSPGKMHIDLIPDFNKKYAGNEVTYFQLNLTPEQMKQLQEILEDVAKNPGNYNLLADQCTSVAVRSLFQVGVKLPAFSKFQAMQNMSGVLMTPNALNDKLYSDKTFVTRIIRFIVGQ